MSDAKKLEPVQGPPNFQEDAMTMTDLFGPPIFTYTRAQAIEDGTLVDCTEWASAEKGFLGGFSCSVVMTRALWSVVDTDALPKSKRPLMQSTRGRAHDVLWMASLAVRGVLKRGAFDALFDLLLSHGRKRQARLRVTIDDEGVTIGFPEDF